VTKIEIINCYKRTAVYRALIERAMMYQ